MLNELGRKTADAIRMLLTQIYLTQSFPFELKIPNKKTIEAIKAGERGDVITTDITELESMFESL